MRQPGAGLSNITMKVNIIRPVKCIDPGPSDVTTKCEETSRVQSSRTTIPGAATSAPLDDYQQNSCETKEDK